MRKKVAAGGWDRSSSKVTFRDLTSDSYTLHRHAVSAGVEPTSMRHGCCDVDV
jgi:hypothetical protein